MAIKITGNDLKIEDVYHVACEHEKVELHPDALERIQTCRRFLEKKIEDGEIMYGINTGIGEFSEVVLSDEQVKQFQRYLIYNHSAGIGEPVPVEEVRAAMLTRINVHARGHSGCRPEITQTYVDMLNKGVTPVVCQKGSVGAC
ncbi:MAG: aromatic amino acid lyase, partial [bacterium]|nr:aromatic amino acid lyase [bacterium]